jgi:hypothetical protein
MGKKTGNDSFHMWRGGTGDGSQSLFPMSLFTVHLLWVHIAYQNILCPTLKAPTVQHHPTPKDESGAALSNPPHVHINCNCYAGCSRSPRLAALCPWVRVIASKVPQRKNSLSSTVDSKVYSNPTDIFLRLWSSDIGASFATR